MPTNQAKSFRRLWMAKWRTKVWNTHQQKPTEMKVKMHQNRLPNPSAYKSSDNWHQWRNENFLRANIMLILVVSSLRKHSNFTNQSSRFMLHFHLWCIWMAGFGHMDLDLGELKSKNLVGIVYKSVKDLDLTNLPRILNLKILWIWNNF